MSKAAVETPSAEANPLTPVATAMMNAANSVADGAKEAVPATGRLVSRVVYSTSYYLSYGVVFPSLLVTSFIPGFGPIANGVSDGATAAKDVVAGMRSRHAEKLAKV